jgi:hypothetical protein
VAIGLTDSSRLKMRLLRGACGAPRNGNAILQALRGLLDPSGHTLAETLVAMSLFVGVLIPLLAAIGNLIFDYRTERLQEALHLAQSEIALAEASQDFLGERTQTIHGLTIERRVAVQGTLAQIDVQVRDTKKANRLVLHLSKTVSLKSGTSPG